MWSGRLFWKLLLVHVVLTTALVGLGVWLMGRHGDGGAGPAWARPQASAWILVFAGVGGLALFVIALRWWWSGPIVMLTAAARGLARGDWAVRTRWAGNDELAMLARALNEMRDHLAEQLRTNEHQRLTLETLLSQLHEGVVVSGPNGRLVLINPAAVQLLGLASSATGRHYSFKGLQVTQVILESGLRDLLIPRVNDHHDSPKAGLDGHVQECRLDVRGPRGMVPVLARASDIVFPSEDSNGSAARTGEGGRGRLLVLTDITELDRLIQVKADFAANASHELRTPLAAIRGAVETLLGMHPEGDAESVQRFLGMIDRQCGRMQELVADLLDLSRLESTAGQVHAEHIEVRGLLNEVKERFLDAMQAKEIHWRSEVGAGCETIVASSHLLRVILDNLVDNAIKFTEPRGQVSLVCKRETRIPTRGAAVTFEVSDTGCGIPREEQERVFERFYQVERSRSGVRRGTGLGLSIVRHAVSCMRGTVRLASQPGLGTTVSVTIPQGPADVA